MDLEQMGLDELYVKKEEIEEQLAEMEEGSDEKEALNNDLELLCDEIAEREALEAEELVEEDDYEEDEEEELDEDED